MACDVMAVRLHLAQIRVLGVVEDTQRAATGRARFERATPRRARSVGAQPVTVLAPYAPVGTGMLAPFQQVRGLER